MVDKLEKLSKERESLKDQVASLQLASQNYQQLEKDHACCKINIRELQSRLESFHLSFNSVGFIMRYFLELSHNIMAKKCEIRFVWRQAFFFDEFQSVYDSKMCSLHFPFT